MSDIQWSSVECTGNSSSVSAGFAAVTDGVANAFGLSFDKEIMTSDNAGTRYYKIRSIPNCYIGFGLTNGLIAGAYLNYKLKSGDFVGFQNISDTTRTWAGTGDGVQLKCKRTDFCGYNLRVICDYKGGSLGGFTTGKFTDYFSKKTYDVVMYVCNKTIYSRYIYDEEDDCYILLNNIRVGGTNYPTSKQNIAVATPVMFGNSKYYGYMGSTSSLYDLYGNYETPGPITLGLGMQAVINGTTFRLIDRNNLFIRSG